MCALVIVGGAFLAAPLAKHLKEAGLEFMQFAFRWMNCMLLRELPLPLVIRLWDTYFCEATGFEDFHVYVSTALLLRFSATLRGMPALVSQMLQRCTLWSHAASV